MIARYTLIASAVFTLVAACGTADSATPAEPQDSSVVATSTTTPERWTTVAPEERVMTVEGLAYRTDETAAHLLDIYYSPAASDGPVVVLLHGGGVDRSYGLYSNRLAPALAEQGAVVFVPDWDDTFGDDPDTMLARHDGTGCAISYAVAHAADYGADTERVVLFGHSGGAHAVVAGGGLRETTPVADCVVEPAPVAADGLVLWDGDWLLGSTPWDSYNTELPRIAETLTPWGYLDDQPTMPIVLISAEGAHTELRRCGVTESAHLFWVRDPDGSYRDRLAQLGALDDGCVDNVETTEILARAMGEAGLGVRHVILEDSGHVSLGGDDQAQLVDEILGVAEG